MSIVPVRHMIGLLMSFAEITDVFVVYTARIKWQCRRQNTVRRRGRRQLCHGSDRARIGRSDWLVRGCSNRDMLASGISSSDGITGADKLLGSGPGMFRNIIACRCSRKACFRCLYRYLCTFTRCAGIIASLQGSSKRESGTIEFRCK